MDQKEIYETSFVLDRKINKLKEQLEEFKSKREALKGLCTHDIVIKYHDNFPSKLSYGSTCYCPACGKIIKCCFENQEMHTPFKDSRIIDLKDLSLVRSDELHFAIRKEIISNMDIYYDSSVPTETLASMMELSLVDMQTIYDGTMTILQRIRK